MTKPWTKQEDDVLRNTELGHYGAAIVVQRGETSVRRRRQKLGIKLSAPTPKATSVSQDREKSNGTFWKTQHDALSKKYNELLKVDTATGQLVELASSLAPRSYSPKPQCLPSNRKPGYPQSAVLLLTDTHVGAVIKPTQTLGFGGYDFDTFLRRLKFLESGVESILHDHVSTKVPELVVCLGGDMLDGNLQHSAEAAQMNTLFQQFYGAGHAIAQFLRNLSASVPEIRLFTAVGNHPRWAGLQHKMPTHNRYSNLDQFLYAYVKALTADLPKLRWNLDAQPFAVFNVQNFKFHLSHGDHLKGGDKALGIPNHAVGRMVSSTAQLYGKLEQAAPHYYLTGHLHRSITLPHARGAVIVNGGFPGIDGYGLMSGFAPIDPTQTLFLVHPKFGKTATFEIQLKHACKTGPVPYNIPVCGEPTI